MALSVEQVLQAHFVRALTKQICGDNPDLVERPAAFVLRKRDEGRSRDLQRLILLPPRGYTANALNEACSHDEAESAKITVKGAIREGKRGFSKLKSCLLVASFNRNSRVSDLDEPYLTFRLDGEEPDLTMSRHSAGEAPFHVVKANGEGFCHNLINLSDDWLMLLLDKRLRHERPVTLSRHLTVLQDEHAALLSRLYEAVVEGGDSIFREQIALVDAIAGLPPAISLPALGEMLHVHDTGRHEACSVFALILKIAKSEPDAVCAFLKRGLSEGDVPAYYARQLLEKIEQRQAPHTPKANANEVLSPRAPIASP